MTAIETFGLDVLVALGWCEMLSRELLQAALLGCVGGHSVLLPRQRGCHPLIWALVGGSEESGLTFFFMDEGADSEGILWQKRFPHRPGG